MTDDDDELATILGLPPMYYYRSDDAQPEPCEPKPLLTWPNSLPVVEFDGSDEALERGRFPK